MRRTIYLPNLFTRTKLGYRAAFWISFFAGIGLVCMLGQKDYTLFTLMNEYYVQKIKDIQISWQDMYIYLLKNRGICFLIITFLMVTRVRKISVFIFLGYIGISLGMAISIFLIGFQTMGMVLFLVAQFPHILFYIAYIWIAYRLTGMLQAELRKQRMNATTKIFFMVGIFILLLLFLVGVFLESYVNPFLLQKIVYML